DRQAHFAAGIGATHILGTALHPPHRGCGTETGKQLPGGGTEPKPMTPLVKRASLHHTGRPPGASAYRGSPYGRERTRFTVPQQVLTHILAISTHILAQKFWLLSRDRQSSEQFAGLTRRYDEMQAECTLVPFAIADTS